MEKNMYYTGYFQTASTGGYGHNILSTGQTSVSGRKYHAIQVIEDCEIGYSNAIEGNVNNGDATVSGLVLTAGTVIVLGVVKDISVVSGKIIAHLITATDV